MSTTQDREADNKTLKQIGLAIGGMAALTVIFIVSANLFF